MQVRRCFTQGMTPSDVAGCAELCLANTSAGIQPPSARWRLWALLGETPGHARSEEQSHRQVREALFDIPTPSVC